jgi:hypothetical protein
MFNQYQQLRKKPYWDNHFWTPGYCVDTVGMDEELIRKYVRYQEEKEKQFEQLRLIGRSSITRHNSEALPPWGAGPVPVTLISGWIDSLDSRDMIKAPISRDDG